MSRKPLTPEELILGLDDQELLELLDDLGLQPSARMAEAIRQGIRELGTFDRAIEMLRGEPDSGRKAA